MQKIKLKQTEIGKIPEDWEVRTLEEVSTIVDCLHSKKPKKQEKGFIYLEVFNLEPKTASIKTDNVTYISKEDYKFWIKRSKPEQGDLVITNTGIVATAMIPKNFECCIGRNMTLVKPNKNIINVEYLRFYSLSRLFKNEMKRLSLSGTILESLHVKFIGKLKIALPSYEEQTRIVELIRPFYEKQEDNVNMNKTLETIGQIIFKKWFLDGRKEEWEISKIGKELKTILGGTPDRTNSGYWNGNINWINSGKVNEFRIIEPSEKITELGLKNSATNILPKDTAVLAITGATLGQVSRLEIDTCANQSVIGILENEKFSSEYIYLWIKNNIDDIISHQTGGAQQHINKSNIDDYHLLVPDQATLKKFNQLIKPLFKQISTNCFQNQTLSSIRDTLLPKLMSGEIRVK